MVTSERAYLVFMGALALERLAELVLSRRNAQRALRLGAVEVGQPHFRVMSVVHVLFLVACPVEVLALHRPFPGTWGWVCLAGALAAQGLRYWAIATLAERWNVRIIVWPKAPPVVRGPYRFVRHPNYVAVILEMLFVPLLHGAWLCAAVFTAANALLLTVRIREEERALGPDYAAAFRTHPRLVPGLRS